MARRDDRMNIWEFLNENVWYIFIIVILLISYGPDLIKAFKGM
jgi:hypothetical protein